MNEFHWRGSTVLIDDWFSLVGNNVCQLGLFAHGLDIQVVVMASEYVEMFATFLTGRAIKYTRHEPS